MNKAGILLSCIIERIVLFSYNSKAHCISKEKVVSINTNIYFGVVSVIKGY